MSNQKQSIETSSNQINQGVVAIIVTYHPTAQTLAQLCMFLAKQVQQIVVVDNGSRDDELEALSA